jgi:photosystem II stability/assembly factor-like uncharacterized protein
VRAALAQSAAPTRQPLALDALAWRHIGPSSFGGRIDDVEGLASNPSVLYVGTAGGGVFKTVNNGTTWTSIFDAAGGSVSIGDIAIAPSDPNIVWVGTGEPNNRQSSTWGDGVYRSLDGGVRWTHMGLRESHHIGRVVIHPRDPNVVYVAAQGRLFGPNEERGLYRTRDGGKSWQRVLGVDQNTGVTDVALDPDGRTLYAATYQRQRRGYGFIGGGPGSGLWRSLDAGDTWERLAGGLPTGTIGRIGLAIAASNPDVVYAIVEHRPSGGVYRSDDRGTTWRRTSPTNPRPMYYSQIRVDPKNTEKVWVLGTNLHLSIDGGKTFRTDGTGELIHVDHHGLWIDPANPDRLVLGNDGGLYVSYDGSRNWHFVDNLPIGQFYDIDIDQRDPYWVYGGTQDNGTWGIPSRTTSLAGITNADVVNIAYGDGFFSVTDPTNPRGMYANSQNGRAYYVDLDTREERGIRPVPNDRKEEVGFNWSTPMVRSPHDPATVYYGGNKLFRTRDRGQTWQEMSPDLSRKLDWKKLPIMGLVRNETTLSRDDGIGAYGTITTIAESPLAAGVLLVGTDDGNVQMTEDGGRTWSNISDRIRLPAPRWVSRVVLSRHERRTAYVTFDGHYDDDLAAYVFRTTDGGRTWSSIAGDLPVGASIKALEEHPRRPNILFAGTEFGLYVTYDAGKSWRAVRGNLPPVRIDDVIYNARDNDLVLGTHGRSIIILDDVRLLDDGDPSTIAEARLFPIRPATQEYTMRLLPTPGASEFSAPNPPTGALLTYILPDEATTASTSSNGSSPPRDSARTDTVARLTITAADGKVVRELTGPNRRGIHRIAWDLRYARPDGVTDQDEGWFGVPRGAWVLPGEYTVTLNARGRQSRQTVTVRADPRARTTPEALAARHAAAVRIQELMRAFTEGSRVVDRMMAEHRRLDSAVKARPEGQDSLSRMLKETITNLDSLRQKFAAGFSGPKFGILDLDAALQASSTGPTEAQSRTLDHLTARLTEDIAELNAFASGAFARLQASAARFAGGTTMPAVAPPRRP